MCQRNEYTAEVKLNREDKTKKISDLELDDLREKLKKQLQEKVENTDQDITKRACYTIALLNLTENLKNSFDAPLNQDQRVATTFSITPQTEGTIYRMWIEDNGSGFNLDFLKKDKERKTNGGLSDYEKILGNSDTIDSPKTKGQHFGGTGRGLAQAAQVCKKLRAKKIICKLMIYNVGSDEKPEGAGIVIESIKSDRPDEAKIAADIFKDVTDEYSDSPNVSCVPHHRTESESSLFSLHLDNKASPQSTNQRHIGDNTTPYSINRRIPVDYSTPLSILRQLGNSASSTTRHLEIANISHTPSTQLRNLYEDKLNPALIPTLSSTPDSATRTLKTKVIRSKLENTDITTPLQKSMLLSRIKLRIEELSVNKPSCCFCFFSGLSRVESQELSFLVTIEDNCKNKEIKQLSQCIPLAKPPEFKNFKSFDLINEAEQRSSIFLEHSVG